MKKIKKIILLGAAFFGFLKLTNAQTGELYQLFGNIGIVKTSFAGSTVYTSTAVQGDGKIVAAGYTWNGSNYDFLLVRYNTNGSLDITFGGNGKLITDFGSTSDYARSVAIQTDGKIVVAGSANDNFALARYNTSGSLDNTFSADGKQTNDFQGSDNATSVSIQKDGKMVLVGWVNDNFIIVRYNTDGSLDNAFSGDGKQTAPFSGPFRFSYSDRSVAIQSDGKIIIIGAANEQFAVARYNTDGSIDSTFSGDGIQLTRVGEISFASTVAIQKDGKIVVAGRLAAPETNGGFGIVRYNTNGSLDLTFSNDGILTSGYNLDYLHSIAIQDDGKIVAGGSFANLNTDVGNNVGPNFALFRYNTNGTPDNTFNFDGIQITEITGADNGIASIAIANNKLYAVGTDQVSLNLGIVASYMLDNPNNAPAVKISIAYNIVRYTSPALIKVDAIATDVNGTISKVQFYNGTTLVQTAYLFPYAYVWLNARPGDYKLTAKATDNSGFSTTSNAIHVVVEDNSLLPVGKIASPVVNTPYTAFAAIPLIGKEKDYIRNFK